MLSVLALAFTPALEPPVDTPSALDLAAEVAEVHEDPLAEHTLFLNLTEEMARERQEEEERRAAEAAQAEQEAAEAAAAEQEAAEQEVIEEAPAATSGIPWDDLAHCESTGDWSIDTGNGFYGGLQFEKQSWDWAGGQQYAEYPHHATREQQIAVAERLLEIHPAGIGAWPACASKLGLR